MPPERVARLEARLPARVYALLKRAAELKGRSISDFVVTAAQGAALLNSGGTSPRCPPEKEASSRLSSRNFA